MTWYPPVVIVAAADEPVSLAEAKAHTRVDGNDDDTSLNNTIAAARAYVEAYCGTPLVSRTVAVKCDYFQDFAVLPLAPVSTISSITCLETAAGTQTLSDDLYELRSDGLTASIVLQYGRSWPTIQPGSRITVTATVGYSSTFVPENAREDAFGIEAVEGVGISMTDAGRHDLNEDFALLGAFEIKLNNLERLLGRKCNCGKSLHLYLLNRHAR